MAFQYDDSFSFFSVYRLIFLMLMSNYIVAILAYFVYVMLLALFVL